MLFMISSRWYNLYSLLQINQSISSRLVFNDMYNRGSLTPVSKQCAEISYVENCNIPALLANGQEEGDVIAICLVIVDELHHEEIWRSWIEDRAEDVDEELLNRSESGQDQPQLKKRCTVSSSSSRSRESNLNADRPDHYLVQGQNNYRNSSQNSRFRGRLFIHAKYPERVKSRWVRERMLGSILMMIIMNIPMIMTMTMTMTISVIITIVMELWGWWRYSTHNFLYLFITNYFFLRLWSLQFP